ncbi:MAG TPA: FAD-dependent oxidoreductase, partial [Solirubrobacter sp.]
MSEEKQVDVAIVGGGPAGMAAAIAARRAGSSVVVIDEYAAPGGQIWRRRFDEVGSFAPKSLPPEAREQVAAFSTSGAELLAGRSVWGTPEPGVLMLTGDGPARVRARAIVLCTGAYDRPVAFPGWTLPGVMTAGGAQALAKGQGVLPGKRVLLAGAGPFLLPVAAQLASLGAEIVAVAEATRRREWVGVGPRMAAHPARLVDYAKYRTRVRKIVWGHVIVRAAGEGRVRSATIAEAGPDWAPAGAETTFEVDAVCTAYGFLPSVDLARALGCELAGDAVAHNEDMRTSVAGVFVAGEATGIGGADLALAEGELAGYAAAAHASTPLTAGIDGHAGPLTR